MSGPGDPPEGTPEGASGGGEDEYRSVVFDESFVKAARIQEYSARERQDDAARPVRIRHVLPRGLARQAVALISLIVLAFGFAIYMGVRHPYKAREAGSGEQLRVTVIPLVPGGTVPAVSPTAPFAGTAAAGYGRGAGGLKLLPADMHRIGGYAESEVRAGYETAREFLTDSAIDAQTVTGGDVRGVLDLLDPSQIDQFESSLSAPAADGTHEATGWLVRFDPDPGMRVELVDGDGVRVDGTFSAAETGDNRLEITADHTYVYAIRGSSDATGPVSLFTVRRQLRFQFDHDELRRHRVEVVQADIAAGPLACAAEVQSYFRPILAGHSAPGAVSSADPYDHARPPGAVCAPLTGAALTPTDTPTPGATPRATGTNTAATRTAATHSAAVANTAATAPTAAGSPADRRRPVSSPPLTPRAAPRSPATYRTP
ncbi:SCO2583 family membrane protein [Streptomyces sp. NBC_01477]|uniref:SCO2583 family membrane protein n=1 Tax=Streptomyces sp. NBC_01477 TaxID=2976015 RepID=UPI002E2EE11D|nr:hypothetical protein [Streptomyces sp. NBC_01477]